MCWVPALGQNSVTHAISFIHHTRLSWSEKQTQPVEAKSFACVPKVNSWQISSLCATHSMPRQEPGQRETRKVISVGRGDQRAWLACGMGGDASSSQVKEDGTGDLRSLTVVLTCGMGSFLKHVLEIDPWKALGQPGHQECTAVQYIRGYSCTQSTMPMLFTYMASVSTMSPQRPEFLLFQVSFWLSTG